MGVLFVEEGVRKQSSWSGTDSRSFPFLVQFSKQLCYLDSQQYVVVAVVVVDVVLLSFFLLCPAIILFKLIKSQT